MEGLVLQGKLKCSDVMVSVLWPRMVFVCWRKRFLFAVGNAQGSTAQFTGAPCLVTHWNVPCIFLVTEKALCVPFPIFDFFFILTKGKKSKLFWCFIFFKKLGADTVVERVKLPVAIQAPRTAVLVRVLGLLCFWSDSLLVRWEGSGWYLTYLGPCHPRGVVCSCFILAGLAAALCQWTSRCVTPSPPSTTPSCFLCLPSPPLLNTLPFE